MNTSDLTVGFDATTQTALMWTLCISQPRKSVIGFDELPEGTGADYANQISPFLDRIASTYSDFNGRDFGECRTTNSTNISNTLTDWAAVIIHLWISLTNCETRGWGNLITIFIHLILWPQDSLKAVNLILALKKLRYKDGKGNLAFKIFLSDHHLSLGTFPLIEIISWKSCFILLAILYTIVNFF